MAHSPHGLLGKIIAVDHFTLRLRKLGADDFCPDPVCKGELGEASAESKSRFRKRQMDLRPIAYSKNSKCIKKEWKSSFETKFERENVKFWFKRSFFAFSANAKSSSSSFLLSALERGGGLDLIKHQNHCSKRFFDNFLMRFE